ncbi:MAG: hypothetical protein GY845_38955, partial [Planctomycetes bacterium]|nr:hypothetical protein [Planctomycetota bacterium]
LLKDSYDYAPALKAKADYTMSDLRSHQQGFMRESQMYAGHKNGASEERVRAVQQYLTTFENTRTMWDMISSSAKEAGTISFYTPQYKSWPSTLINLKSQMDNILADPAQYEAAFKQNGYSIDKIKENEERINSAIQRHEHAGYAAGLAEKYRKEFDAFVGLRGEYQSSFGNDGEERRRAVLVEQLSADAKSLMKTAQELAGDKAFTPHLAHNKLTPGMIYQHIAQDIEAYAEHVTGRNQEAVEAVEHSIDVDAIDPDILLTDYIRVNSEYDEIYKALVGSIGKPGHEAQTEEYYYARKKIAQQLTAMGAGILEHKKITDEQLSKASLSIKEVEERHSLHMKVSKKQSKEQKHEISRSRDRGRDADEYSIDVDAIGPAQKAKADYTMSDLRSHQQGFKRESQMYAGHENAISEEHTRVVKQYREVFNYTKEMWNHISASAEEASIAHFYTPQYMSWPSAITKIKSQMDNILADPAQYEAAFNKHGFRIDKIIENEELISKAIQQHEHASYAAELAEKYRKEFDMFVGLRGEYHSSFGNDGEEGRRAGLVEQMSVVAKPLMKTAQELAGDKAFTPYLAHNKLTPEMISQHIAQDLKAYAEHVTGRNQEAAEHSIDVDAIDPDILLTDYICVNREYDKVYVDLLSSLGKPGLSAKNEEYYYARKKIAQQLTVMGAGILGHMKITGEQLSKASLSIKEIEERHSLYMKVSQKQSRVQTRKITQSHGRDAAEYRIDVDTIDPEVLLADYVRVNSEYDKVYVDLLSSLGKPGLSAKNEEYYHARKKLAQQLTAMGAGILEHKKITAEQLSKASLSIKEIEERHSL